MSAVQRRILAVASGGGHWVQMLRLDDAFRGCEVAYVSVHGDYSANVPGCKFYKVSDASRFDVWRLAVVALQLLVVIVRVRPHVVVTTGSFPGLLAIAIAKTVFRIRTVWIDSIANCEQLSTSGRLAGKFADRWLTQWPHLEAEGGPSYWGAVL
jgi:UDP-N-acetylglucosamine:LPS N-acetylglucosamine transferase